MHLVSRSIVVLAAGAIVMSAAPALAAGKLPTPRLFLDGTAGTTFNQTTTGVFSGGASATINPYLQISGEFGRYTDLLPKSTSDALTSLAATYVGDDGAPVTFDASQPATFGAGTVRVNAMPRRRVSPFAEGGAGFAHLTTHLAAFSSSQDTAIAFETAAGLTSAMTKPMMSLGGGVTIAANRRSSVDVGYQFDRIFTDTAINTNRILASMRVGF